MTAADGAYGPMNIVFAKGADCGDFVAMAKSSMGDPRVKGWGFSVCCPRIRWDFETERKNFLQHVVVPWYVFLLIY